MRSAAGRSIDRVLGLVRTAYAHDLDAAPCQLGYNYVQPAGISCAEWKWQGGGDNHYAHRTLRYRATRNQPTAPTRHEHRPGTAAAPRGSCRHSHTRMPSPGRTGQSNLRLSVQLGVPIPMTS